MSMRFLKKVNVAEASLWQSKLLAIAPKISSTLSFFSSLYIVYDVAKRWRKRPKSIRTYHRIVIGMSISDCLASFAWFFTTWPIPPDVFPAWGASGTQATCTAQGFITQASVCTVFYNGCLAMYYCLVVRYGWSDRRIKDSKVERYMHLVSIVFALWTSTVGAALGLFNPIGWDCWLASVPLGCKESWLNHGETTCIRGDNANLYQWLFFYLPLWIVIIIVSIAMYMVYQSYSRQVEVSSRWDEMPSSNSRPQDSMQSRRNRLLATQAMLYVGSFFITWFFPTILRIHEVTNDVVYYHWVILSAIFVPSQGLLNLYVYVRPRRLRAQPRTAHRVPSDTYASHARRSTNISLPVSSGLKSEDFKSSGEMRQSIDSAGSFDPDFDVEETDEEVPALSEPREAVALPESAAVQEPVAKQEPAAPVQEPAEPIQETAEPIQETVEPIQETAAPVQEASEPAAPVPEASEAPEES